LTYHFHFFDSYAVESEQVSHWSFTVLLPNDSAKLQRKGRPVVHK